MQEKELITLLTHSGVDIAKFGTGKAKPFTDLLKEINDGETVLTEEKSGLVRNVSVVSITLQVDHPRHGRLQLFEKKQIFTDGRERVRDYLDGSLFEKILPEEDIERATVRAIREELDISEEGIIKLVLGDTNTREAESPSYPGLRARYIVYQVNVSISFEVYLPEYQEVRENKTTFFEWKSIAP